ncbi:MAG: alpha/beta fold hydrolase, partial [Pseudomonadota bacterium]
MKRINWAKMEDLIRKIAAALPLAALFAAAVLAGALAPPSMSAVAAASAQFRMVGGARHFNSAAGVTARNFVARVGASPFDRIGLHRIAPAPGAGTTSRAVLLYLPGTNMNGLIPVDDPRYSLPLYLAVHGVEVWTFDYRTHFVPSTTPKADLAEMAGWTNEVFESDINAAADFVMGRTGRKEIFVAGFSRGVEFAYLFAAMHPDKVRGLVGLDGFIPRRASHQPPAGRYADDIGGRHLTFSKRQVLMEAVIKNPNGPAPLPRYKTAAENLAHVVYDAGGVFGGHGGLANPLGGYSD